MERFLGILLFLFAFQAHAAIPSGVPSKTLGGATTHVASMPVDPGNITVSAIDQNEFTLYANCTAAEGNGANTVLPFFKNGVKYQVPSGYTARCDSVTHQSGSTDNDWQLAYSMTSFNRSAASITSGVYQAGASGFYAFRTSSTANTIKHQGLQYTFPSASYPGAQIGTGSIFYSIALQCRETLN